MTAPDDSAFPSFDSYKSCAGAWSRTHKLEPSGGLSKRELFSALALQGLLANPRWLETIDSETASGAEVCVAHAKLAISMARALEIALAEREP